LERLLVPEKLSRRERVWAIRRYFDERFRNDEKIAEVCVYHDKCYVKLQKPNVEYSDQGRLQYHDEEFNLRFEIIRGSGGIVMEG